MAEVSPTSAFGIKRSLGEELPNAFNLSLTGRRQELAESPHLPQETGVTFPGWLGLGVEASCPSLDMEMGQWNRPSFLFIFIILRWCLLLSRRALN